MAMAAPSFALSAVTSDGTAEPFEGRESKEGVAAEDYQCAVCLGLPLAPVVVRAAALHPPGWRLANGSYLNFSPRQTNIKPKSLQQ